MNEKPILTITMLVSSRPDTLPKCLASLKPLLDAIPSELILVDTAQDESCLEIAHRYTDRIIPFQWCDDFAAARNTGLKEAKGEWVMFIDDDEWFEDVSSLTEFFQSGTYKQYASASYIVRNYSNLEGTGWQDHTPRRLCKRTRDTCFVGRIHESLFPLLNPVFYCKDFAHHYGYVFSSAEEKRKHSFRNIDLLLRSLKEQPDNAHDMMQLIQEYLGVHEYHAALTIIKRLLTPKNLKRREFVPYTAYAQVMEVNAYRNQQRYDLAYESGINTLAKKPPLFAQACIYNLLAGICCELDKTEEALSYTKLYASACKEWSGTQEEKDLLTISSIYLNDREQERLLLLSVHLYCTLEQYEEAANALSQYPWELPESRLLSDTMQDLTDIIFHTPARPVYAEALKRLYTIPACREDFLSALDKYHKQEANVTNPSDGFLRLLAAVCALPGQEDSLVLYRLLSYSYAGQTAQIQDLLYQLCQKGHSPFVPSDDFWTVLSVSFDGLADSISMHTWMEGTDRLVLSLSSDAFRKAYQLLSAGVGKSSIKYQYLTAALIEKELLECNVEQTSSEELWEKLTVFSKLTMTCCFQIYREEVFTSELSDLLPERYLFAWDIFQAESVQDLDLLVCCQKLRDAAVLYPPFAPHIQKVLKGRPLNRLTS